MGGLRTRIAAPETILAILHSPGLHKMTVKVLPFVRAIEGLRSRWMLSTNLILASYWKGSMKHRFLNQDEVLSLEVAFPAVEGRGEF